MANPYILRLITPYKSVFEDQVEAVIVPGELGKFGVLSGHTKFVTTLVPGMLRYVKDGRTVRYAISGGFAEVHPQGVTVLADSMERPQDIDVQRAKTSLENASERLKNKADLDPAEVRHLEVRLARAQNRLEAAKTG